MKQKHQTGAWQSNNKVLKLEMQVLSLSTIMRVAPGLNSAGIDLNTDLLLQSFNLTVLLVLDTS